MKGAAERTCLHAAPTCRAQHVPGFERIAPPGTGVMHATYAAVAYGATAEGVIR